MSGLYQALYRKWRPLTFTDVVSQPSITTTLQNQIASGRTTHAYLFTGSRGTGKTSCARIFAKAINCLSPKDGNPCLECENCKDAEDSALSDIIEIDAASNNGVDDMRTLREGTAFTPERCAYKVYIIDEVHMMTGNAFNAFLKILEEPPPYVKFILATTEAHKVPATILSRCQRFDFRRILPADITTRLEFIAGKEEISLDKNAAELIARISDGGMRDAISLLDRCAAFSTAIDLATVSTAAGMAGRDYLFDLLEAIASDDPTAAITIVDRLYAASKDVQCLCEELIEQLRNLMLVKSVPDNTDLLICMPEEIVRLKAIAQRLPIESILGKLSVLQECNNRLTRSRTKRIEFEMGIIKLTARQVAPAPTPAPAPVSAPAAATVSAPAIAEVRAPYEPDYEDIPPPKSSQTQSTPATQPQVAALSQPVVAPSVDLSKLRVEDFLPCGLWSEVLEEFSKKLPSVSGSLVGSKAFVNGNVMLISAENAFFLRLFKDKENARILGDVVQYVLGKPYVIRAKSATPPPAVGKSAAEVLDKARANGIPVEVE